MKAEAALGGGGGTFPPGQLGERTLPWKTGERPPLEKLISQEERPGTFLPFNFDSLE